MDAALAKIRPHTSSQLSHQKTPANLLNALDSTFKEQKTESSPTAYFAALLTTLDGTIQSKVISFGDGDVLPAELYLLALVAPFVPQPVIRSNLTTIVDLTSPLFPQLSQYAPALRSQISIYQSLFLALERSQLNVQGIRQSFASVLQFCIDPRPKVRKKAAEAIRDVLAAPPTPMSRHPYAEKVSAWIITVLKESSTVPIPRSKSATDGAETAVHLLPLLRSVLALLPPTSLPEITNLVLSLPRLGNPFLSSASYAILADIFVLDSDEETLFAKDQIPEILQTILSSPPSKFDTNFSSAWVRVVGHATIASHKVSTVDPEKVWKSVWPFLQSEDSATRKASAESLGHIASCHMSESSLDRIIKQVSDSVDSIVFSQAIPDLFSVISSLIINTKTEVFIPLVQHIGELRTHKGFEHKESADQVLSTAIQVFGPHIIVREDILPLNLEPSDREAGREPRAYILPLLSNAHHHPSPLKHFVEYFVPLSERMFEYQQNAEASGRQSEGKVWSVLIAQIWAGLAVYCYGKPDIKDALTPQFSQLLSSLLYGQPELRPAVLKALKVMIDSNISPTETIISTKNAEENIQFLSTQAESWLAVFFNVFSSISQDSRNVVGDVISAWASICGEEELRRAYTKVVELLKTNTEQNDTSVIITTQDLLLLLSPYFTTDDATMLFKFCLTPSLLSSRDNAVQKRTYKLLAKLVDSGKITDLNTEEVLKHLDSVAEGLSAAAKKDRFLLYTTLIPRIPSDSLHLIVNLIPEAVLGTKEPSDKARQVAFDLILAMGKKMKAGGVVKRSLMGSDEMEIEGEVDTIQASVEEFMTMIAGGLAGASPHMISATITAISRLVFEFKDDISRNMHSEIVSTMLVFLTSANREIVKSTLGFIKLSIHTLPTDLLRPHLKVLVPALLGWSHDHKNHFKVKVRHIFERMLRRFGWDDVYGCVGDEEAGKVLLNIKKRKERAKRRKVDRDDEGEEEDEEQVKPKTGDAFEDVLYGSESELEDSADDERPAVSKSKNKSKKESTGPRLRLDGDDPIDLLKGATSKITNAKSNNRRPGKDAARFRTDEDTGKMVIDESASSLDEAAPGKDTAGTAYQEAITSVDGFTRGPNGRVKFNKDTKKRRRDAADLDEDIEMADDTRASSAKNQKRKPSFGSEFRSKKAGGDLKKGGVDPYAYMPISQAAKKTGSGKRNRLGVAGKQ